MRAYSMDLRERVLLDSDAGMKAADVAAKYRVSGSWVRLLKQRRRETGEVAPRVQRHGRRCMLEPHLHTLADLIAAHPDRTLAELKDALATPASVPTVWRAVRALGLTVKKKRSARPNTIGLTSAAARVAWHAAAPTWDVAHLVFLDETGITNNLLRRYGRAPRGARVHDHAPCGRRQTSTFLAALRVTGLTAPGSSTAQSMARASALTSNRSWCRLCSQATSSLPTTSGPTRSPASGGLSRPPGPPSGTCHPIARTSIPSSSASRSSRPSFAPHAVAAVRRSGRSLVPVSSASALTNAATIFGTAGTQPPHGHEKRSNARLQPRGLA